MFWPFVLLVLGFSFLYGAILVLVGDGGPVLVTIVMTILGLLLIYVGIATYG